MSIKPELYKISCRSMRLIEKNCQNNDTTQATDNSREPYVKVVAYGEKFISICKTGDPVLISEYISKNKAGLFLSYKSGRAFKYLENIPSIRECLFRELQVTRETLKKVVLLNYHASVAIILNRTPEFNFCRVIQRAQEKDFIDMIKSTTMTGDPGLLTQLFALRHQTVPLRQGYIVIAVMTAAYSEDLSLFANLLCIYINQAKAKPEMRHFSRYILCHAFKTNSLPIFSLVLKSISYQWLIEYDKPTMPIQCSEIEDYESVPKYMFPALISYCSSPDSPRSMFNTLSKYLVDNTIQFGGEYHYIVKRLAADQEQKHIILFILNNSEMIKGTYTKLRRYLSRQPNFYLYRDTINAAYMRYNNEIKRRQLGITDSVMNDQFVTPSCEEEIEVIEVIDCGYALQTVTDMDYEEIEVIESGRVTQCASSIELDIESMDIFDTGFLADPPLPFEGCAAKAQCC